jgi:hypothetical protein
MGKLDIGVGDEFPVDEPPPPSPEDAEATRAAREDWHRQKEEWHRYKHEWRAQRDAFRDEMRSRRDAFKDDVKRSIRTNFGGRRFYAFHMGGGPFVLRFLVVLGIVALAIALMPFLLMFGMVALALVLFFAAGRGGRGDYPPGRPNTSQ